jgi:hypothetical protein
VEEISNASAFEKTTPYRFSFSPETFLDPNLQFVDFQHEVVVLALASSMRLE